MDVCLWIYWMLIIIYGIVSAANHEIEGEAGYQWRDKTRDGRLGNLTCYSCYYHVHGNNCLTMMDSHQVPAQACQLGEYFCKVRRFVSDNKLETFERSCSSECSPGCDTYEGVFPIQTCHSCCREDLCNTDNASPPTPTASLFLLSASYSITLFSHLVTI